MEKNQIEWGLLSIEDLIQMNVLVPYWDKLPCRLIVILKEEYKEALFNYAKDQLVTNVGYKYTNFLSVCRVIETWSSTNLVKARGLPEWSPKQYWHYLYRYDSNLDYLFFGDPIMKNKKKKKRWVREMARIYYFERLYENK